MNYKDLGVMRITDANEMNVPVNSFLTGPNEDCSKWRWQADNFMPRRGILTNYIYEIEADSKETILKAVHEYVVPLYEAALKNLKTKGSCYYWESQ